ncbi:hypothetical protein Hanom_Chr00s098091g01802321 [Helianthus anomalus]
MQANVIYNKWSLFLLDAFTRWRFGDEFHGGVALIFRGLLLWHHYWLLWKLSRNLKRRKIRDLQLLRFCLFFLQKLF